MADPLSTATRATKRNLLLASVLAISANAFNVSIDKIPVAGLSITFDDRLFAFLLLIVLAYFLCTFVLYYVIDIKNLPPTEHQSSAEKTFLTTTNSYFHTYGSKVRADLQQFAPVGDSVMLDTMFENSLDKGGQVLNLRIVPQPGVFQDHSIFEKWRADNPNVNDEINARQRYWIARYKRARYWHYRRHQIVLVGTRAMYFTRNYFFDGALPILLGILALGAILGHWNLTWVQSYLPSFKALSSHH
jgi:hypothetical protein